MTGPHPLLLIEDTPSLQMVYAAVLRAAGHEVKLAGTAAEGLDQFQALKPPIVLLDLMLPDRDGLALMRDCLEERPETRFLVITADGSINRAVEAMRAGAHDFLVKPFDETRLLSAVENAQATLARAPAGPDLSGGGPVDFHGFIGSSPEMQELYRRISSIGRSLATVFISGESGTGKEVCAQAIHDLSNRANRAFVPLNCGAIPPDMLESEVFGHLRGAFPGAISNKLGAAAAADGGTLFLDEVCEMDLNLQTKLLRFLQTSTINPVGAANPTKVDVRIICSTNRDPLDEVRKGRFREDLFYRLHVVPVHLPPLRDRGEDVIEIAEHVIGRMAAEEGRDFSGLSPAVQAIFRRLPWPGNVRQMLNVLRNVVVLHDGPRVTEEMLPIELLHADEAVESGTEPREARPPGLDGLIGRSLAEIEKLVIEETIARYGGVPKAARVLDVSPSTLYRKRKGWEC
ncbi:sigma-54-dependent Fis family transcriptional regulator [Maritimibacter sp. 55A14]|uniref:sigma-54-dependent transcriptional regulator n=1 Tax=Maritimibacter sp. 55A14 TaxID=2174844 RepID=UPI000D62072B|nr:sigma-54 dependent transcriptional regulator [Maritimibacter sp. 55A14]PWE28872.1 sigma-54-dependent Fis family transcriptional regulator [Maritimibacter sp. 55A14]